MPFPEVITRGVGVCALLSLLMGCEQPQAVCTSKEQAFLRSLSEYSRKLINSGSPNLAVDVKWPSGIALNDNNALNQRWQVTSDTLDIFSAKDDALAQAKAGNCRLIGERGYSVTPARRGDKGAEFAGADPIYGYIIVSDTADYGGASVQKARIIASAYGDAYNAAIVQHCDYSPEKTSKWRASMGLR